MIWADLHVHSKFSDGSMTISELVDFYGSRGFGCIAITDHVCESQTWLGMSAKYLEKTLTEESFPSYLRELERESARALDQYGMVVLSGVEISKNSIRNSRSAHVLGLGISSWVSADDDIAVCASRIRAQGAVTIAAHPVWTRRLEAQTFHLWNRRKELAPLIDAWEIASGPTLFPEVGESGLPIVASSDLHIPKQINAWKTVLHCEPSAHACLEAVRKQRISIRYYADSKASRQAPNWFNRDFVATSPLGTPIPG